MSGATRLNAPQVSCASANHLVTRFAPSPNGPLHLGHAYSAIVAHDLACTSEDERRDALREVERTGRFVLRIEDIDGTRSRPEHALIYREQLAWLGLEWDDVPPQSARIASYGVAALHLYERNLLYRCTCTRSDVAVKARKTGPEGPIYPGTCRRDTGRSANERIEGDACASRDFLALANGALNRNVASKNSTDLPKRGTYCWRLDMDAALAASGPLTWYDVTSGEQQAAPEMFGDVVLWRKDVPASYHLAVTLDDAADGVTLVTRGADLFYATHIHRLLQALLVLPVPQWYHHGLLLDAEGRKLAKRRGSAGLSELLASGIDGLQLAERLRRQDFPAGISLSKSV